MIVDDCPVAFLEEPVVVEGYHGKVKNPPRGIWGLTDAAVDVSIKA